MAESRKGFGFRLGMSSGNVKWTGLVTTIILGKFSGSGGIYSINPSHSCTISFITEDSYKGDITNPLSLNLYTYVYNNPLIYIDPSGMSAATAKWDSRSDNQKLYLENLAAEGNSWAKQQLKDLVCFFDDDGNLFLSGEVWAAKHPTYSVTSSSLGISMSNVNILSYSSSTSEFNISGNHTAGYGDINVTVISPYGVGKTGGTMVDNTGNNLYSGFAIGTPGVSTSGTGSTKYTVTEGWNIAVQGQAFGGAFQGGYSFGNKRQPAGGFWEAGGGAGWPSPISLSVVLFEVK